MSRHFRILTGQNSTTTDTPPPDQPSNVNSDFVVILAALLCALICVLSLVAVARCAWIRRISGIVITGRVDPSSPLPPPPTSANKGLKKKVLKTLPKSTYHNTDDTIADNKVTDCAICLTEFVIGDEIRVLPQCDHCFHVVCIDTWFGSHSSCPSCRKILIMPTTSRCNKCGELPNCNSVNTFLP
uniref:RING-H2 finger protein ATL8-like n=1 Tax=Erigeron canadensis TaxID=72917 RepID=UPI001CB952E0|nr:RING-H2 finger protein ATL8-like [Erigeron canadensis]